MLDIFNSVDFLMLFYTIYGFFLYNNVNLDFHSSRICESSLAGVIT